MIRDYLRITPTSEQLDPEPVASSLQSLYKLSDRDHDSTLGRLNPFSSAVPVTFEFLAISEGRDEPIEFYFGGDARLDPLEQELDTVRAEMAAREQIKEGDTNDSNRWNRLATWLGNS